jgi:hypothetical protein
MPAKSKEVPTRGNAPRSRATFGHPSVSSDYRLRDARRDCRLAVACADRSVGLELILGSQTLLAGQWTFEVRRGGRSITPVSAWTETCRLADRDVDYLELRIDLAGGLCLERHFVLARQERFLLLADAVLGHDACQRRMEHCSVPDQRRTEFHSVPAKKQLTYCGTLPLAPGVAWRGANESREGLLVGRRRALVLPLALPEWRAENGAGDFGVSWAGLPTCLSSNGRLGTCPTLHQTASGRALFAPLFFDLDGRRLSHPATWRQLTVGQKGVVQPADAAVGYRVAVGGRQWLVYRSLAPATSRTLLGHNLNSETLVARFRRDGEVETLIEVE